MLEGIDALWQSHHPDVVPELFLPGTATAAGALTLGYSRVAPMGAEFSARELAAYRANVGGDPLAIRVAHCSLNPAARSAPIGIYVNIQNPLARLTVRQVAAIFTAGSPEGDLSQWSQLVTDKGYAQAPIHACGIAQEAAAGLSPGMLAKLGASSYAFTYTPLPQSRDAVQCVADDKFAIAFASANIVDPHVKLVAIAEKPGGPFVLPTPENVVAGAYPFDRFLFVYLRKVPGAALDSTAKAYARLMLSPEGQRIIAAAPPGYLPLNAGEIAAESAKLEGSAAGEGSTPEKAARASDKLTLSGAATSLASAARIAEAQGAVPILAPASLVPVMERLSRAFENTHAQPRIAVQSDQSNLLGLSGITFGTSLLSPMTHAAYPLELRPFLQVHGHAPRDIVVAHLQCGAAARPFPALYGNARLPPIHLTWQQVGRILTRGSKGGDITTWDQLGVRGAWAGRAIHVYGPPDDGGFVSGLRHASFGGNPLSYRYEALDTAEQVAAALQGDMYGIGLVQRWDDIAAREPLRLLPVSAPSAQNGDTDGRQRDRDPFGQDLHFYLEGAPDSKATAASKGDSSAALNSLVTFALSPAGQRAITQQRGISGCTIQALTPAQVSRERSKLP